MNEVDRRLEVAVRLGLDPKVVSPSWTHFAWFPVRAYDYVTQDWRVAWLERVYVFRPLGLFNEYRVYAGSPSEYADKHGGSMDGFWDPKPSGAVPLPANHFSASDWTGL